ncbi:MAG: carboxypeptidase-like regulatory domain-containing protein [Halobacteriales archaeon]|nr:carboxypeptidase-like regulatory domain-containing protein [Halobacteriales archaeon]
MRVVFLGVALLFAAPLLAGCTDSGGPADKVREDSQVPVGHVSATTGAVRGVVVDPAIVPVSGALVTLSFDGGSLTKSTENDGQFVFSDVLPGTLFLSVSHMFFENYTTTVEVAANVADPPVVHVQLTPLYASKPYTAQFSWEGFFECSQAGMGLYSSSNCVTDQCPALTGDPATCNGLPTSQMNNVTSQQREWHSDVGAGYRTLIFDVTWEGGGDFSTSQNMGIVVSTYKPERDPAHTFANVAGPSPLTVRMENGTKHPTASGVEPKFVPDEGMARMSYFVSVRKPGPPQPGLPAVLPGLAMNQSFKVIHTQFYVAKAPADWSAAKDDRPF